MTPFPNLLLLQTGWFNLQLDCRKVPAWFAPLQKRYAGFLSASPPPSKPLEISLFPAQAQAPATENKVPLFLPDGVIFSPPGWEGRFDFQTRTGWMRPRSRYILEEIDYFLRVVCAVQAFQSGGFLFHAAGILRDQKVYVFFGHSGTGKTTISRLSGKENVLNDDLVFLQPAASGWTVYGSPFFNPTQIAPQENRQGPLAAMFHLVQDQAVYLEKTSPGQSLAEIVANIPVISTNVQQTFELLSRCQTLLTDIPTFHLHFRKDDSFWELIEKMG